MRATGAKIGTALMLIASCIAGCKSGSEDVDVSGIQLEVKLQRFDRDLMDLRGKDLTSGWKAVEKNYPDFAGFYARELMRFPELAQAGSADPLQSGLGFFLNNPAISGLQDTVNIQFPDEELLNEQLTDLYRHIRYHFKDFPLPQPVAVITEFQYGCFTYDTSWLALGLDRHLGNRYPYYEGLGFYDYVQRKMNRDHLIRNAAESLYNLYYGADRYNEEHSLLEAMIERGKRWYFIKKVMPQLSDTALFGYTPAQTEWCRLSEKAVWQFLNDRDLLYQKNYMEQKRYLDESPSTPGMPSEAPGYVPVWIGYRIVSMFAENKGKGMSPDRLLQLKPMEIFQGAAYRPGN